ncbi:MAG TPA: hypothetical protein PKY59_22075 [Pyrinomonadaceae bacterium]|nr:hypothetical protein [Pyrinomonadaceae bacterium]
MRKSLKLILPIILVVFTFFLVYYAIGNHENALKCIFNKDCRIVSNERDAIIKVDGNVAHESKVFENEENFYFVSDAYLKDRYFLYQINKSKNDVMYPIDCYEVSFGSYLILPDCARSIFLSNSAKGDGFDTQLKITDTAITFRLPEDKHSNYPEHKIEILFNGE